MSVPARSYRTMRARYARDGAWDQAAEDARRAYARRRAERPTSGRRVIQLGETVSPSVAALPVAVRQLVAWPVGAAPLGHDGMPRTARTCTVTVGASMTPAKPTRSERSRARADRTAREGAARRARRAAEAAQAVDYSSGEAAVVRATGLGEVSQCPDGTTHTGPAHRLAVFELAIAYPDRAAINAAPSMLPRVVAPSVDQVLVDLWTTHTRASLACVRSGYRPTFVFYASPLGLARSSSSDLPRPSARRSAAFDRPMQFATI